MRVIFNEVPPSRRCRSLVKSWQACVDVVAWQECWLPTASWVSWEMWGHSCGRWERSSRPQHRSHRHGTGSCHWDSRGGRETQGWTSGGTWDQRWSPADEAVDLGVPLVEEGTGTWGSGGGHLKGFRETAQKILKCPIWVSTLMTWRLPGATESREWWQCCQTRSHLETRSWCSAEIHPELAGQSQCQSSRRSGPPHWFLRTASHSCWSHWCSRTWRWRSCSHWDLAGWGADGRQDSTQRHLEKKSREID